MTRAAEPGVARTVEPPGDSIERSGQEGAAREDEGSRPRAPVFLAALAGMVVVVAIGVLALTQLTKASPVGMFPDRLAGMTLAVYVDGPTAVGEVKAMHSNPASVRIDDAYLARYEGAGGDRARFWVSVSPTGADATSLLDAMRARIGGSGVFGQPAALSVEGTTVYFVSGPPEIGLYNYFYARGRNVYWVQVDGADAARRLTILAEAVRRVTR